MKTSKQNISRRNFIKLSGLTGAAFTLGFYFPANAKEAKIIKADDASVLNVELNAWISIDTSGKVTIINHRSEMGQGSFQSVPQIIAEELEVDMNDINIVFAQGSQTKYGSQITGGSSTIRGSYQRLLKLSASAREMLIESAARQWKVEKTECYAERGHVIHKPSGKKLHYGALVEEASKLQPPAQVELKRPSDYKIIRKPLPRQDTPLKTNGTAIFGLDKKIPGMLYAVVERNPRFLGKVKSFDDAAAKAVPGVKHVIPVKMRVFSHDREGVAVVADNLWSAMQGRKALKVVWDDNGFEHHSTEQLYAKMNESFSTGKALSFKTKGDAGAAYATASKKLEAVYETPYESHSCMEPLNCIAHFKDNKLEIWGPIQGPDWVQKDVADLMGLKADDVTVNMTFLGGGFGRKAFLDYPHEAAVISKAINAPVQVVWSREDDMTQGPFRPGMVYQCRGVLDGTRMSSFETKVAGQNMGHQNPGANKKSYNSSITEGFLETYLDSIPNYSFSDVPLESPIPVMWWRSVYSSTNGFAFESFIDELAVAAAMDPLAFRRQHLWNGRYHDLINKLEEVSGWKSRSKNAGFGVAITECFNSIVGEVVKVSKATDGKIKIDKIWAVMDCGWYVNPDIVKAQVEGSIVMAHGAAVKHATHFKDGMAVERNFDSYKMSRINEIPEIEVHIMDNEEKAGGVGEPALPPFTAALTNAIFDLTGKRIRKVPFSLDQV
ncbi:molybdopterin cofactor-binding domain-containing protein [Pseudochryseolinea flava]|uniref:Xanthine dehydrogenase family protein molybdopterin-binding subunit n=1 Tax=Pseudochryseolinea flava TaxID=2059302 RepID=A0A364XYD5_9BACT|nr:molybdopterin cofactor-binding domain-containing protein [Pseudochryseolinea flava]RAV99347.1 xanthine dehydrogenase family protein molybdopterin-binding subunit [Pseudochryseolinea flava]